MRKALLIIAALCVSTPLALAQTVLPLEESYLLRRKIDVGIRVGIYPYVHNSFNDGNSIIYLNDPYGNSGDVRFKSHVATVDIPVNLKFGLLNISGSAGVKWLGYTLLKQEFRSGYATRTISYPGRFSDGYLNSFWGTCSLAAGVEYLKLGVSLDFLLGSGKNGNPDNSFISIGKNSYSQVVPAVFVEAGFATAHFRFTLRGGFENRGHLGAISMYRLTGRKQLNLDGNPVPILGLLITYKLYCSYGTYRVYY